MTSDELELKSLYQALRQQDAQRAPSFAASLRALPPHAQVGTLRALMITAALVAIVVAAGVNALLRREPAAQQRASAPVVKVAPVAVPPQVAKVFAPTPAARRHRAATPKPPKIEDWVSPTDAWLVTPGSEFRSTLPSLHYNAVSLN